jgi:mannose-6-phosphate isomerase-like protein (cupin superfamily)
MKFTGNIIAIAKANGYFRQVVETGKASQVVVMKLQPNEDIGEEMLTKNDIVILCTDGAGRAVIDGEPQHLASGDLVFVSAGTLHNVINSGTENLELCMIYAPPVYPPRVIHETKEKAWSQADPESLM